MLIRFWQLFVLASMAVVFNANASNHGNGIEYTFGELRYVDVDGGDGIEIGGSFRFDKQIYGLANFQDIDVGRASLEFLEFGGGYIIPNNKIDFVAEVSLISADGPGNSDTGFALSGGGRTFLTPELEGRILVRHEDIFNDSDTFIELGGDFFLGPDLSIGITLDLASEADRLTFGGRFYF